jgi:hypothetical protein
VQQQHAKWELDLVRTIRFPKSAHTTGNSSQKKAIAQTSEIQKSSFFSPLSINGPFGNANNREWSLNVYNIKYGNFETRQVRKPGSNSRNRSGLRIIAAMAVSTALTNLSAVRS